MISFFLAKLIACSFVENSNFTSDMVSLDVSQPIKGFIPVFNVSNSTNQFFVFLSPDYIAVLVGLYILALFITLIGRGGRI